MSKRHNEIFQEKVQAIRLVLTFVGLPTTHARKILAHLEKLGYQLTRKETKRDDPK